jgi:deazaflavin-dependent oxidoreductase (nitroreductase family)
MPCEALLLAAAADGRRSWLDAPKARLVDGNQDTKRSDHFLTVSRPCQGPAHVGKKKARVMAARCRLTVWRRVLNRVVRTLLRMGLGPRRTYLLTVRGRRSGRLYSTPVTLVDEGGQRWLVAPYGEVAWVRNARAAREVILRRRRHSEIVAIAELGPQESAPVLKRYVTEVPITRPYFDAGPHSPVEAFEQEADRHPVFRVGG